MPRNFFFCGACLGERQLERAVSAGLMGQEFEYLLSGWEEKGVFPTSLYVESTFSREKHPSKHCMLRTADCFLPACLARLPFSPEDISHIQDHYTLLERQIIIEV